MRHLWKEWRDHRAVVLGIAVAVPLLLALARALLPAKADAVLPAIAAVGTLAIVLLAFATDLVPGETRRGRLEFLARLPGGLGAAFRAKLVFFLLALALAPAYGFVVGACFAGWPGDGLGVASGYALAVLYAAPWVFAVSCWLPRGALALPATALVLGLLALPLYLLHLGTPDYVPLTIDLIAGGAAVAAGALAVAWVSFTRGYRRGGTFLSAGWRGLAASLVLLAPVYGYAGYRVHEWETVDPQADAFRISGFATGENERFLFVNATMRLRDARQVRPHALLVDVKTGRWTRVGHRFASLGGARTDPAPVVAAYVCVPTPGYFTRYYDAQTGERFAGGWSFAPPAEARARATRDRPTLLKTTLRFQRTGLGWVFRNRETGWRVADPIRERLFDVDFARRSPLVLREGWLVFENDRPVLRDPETGHERELPFDVDRVRGVLPDGRLLYRDDHGLRIADVASGKSTPVPLPSSHSVGQIRGPLFRTFGDRTALARFDPQRNRFEVLYESSSNPHHPVVTDRSILFVENDTIRRLDRRTRGVSTLFPR